VETLERFVAEQRTLWEVPGCAVGVIRGSEVILGAGFGTKTLGVEQPVSTRTIFPIGSTTKSFTAAAVGTLVDDGLLEWDKPLREYIPEFSMHDPVAGERTTVRDLLSHRSGLPRHEFVWLGHPDRTRADFVRRLRYLPLSADIRQTFQYTNLGYVTVGHLIDVVAGMSWEEFVSTRLLKPLAMDRSNISIAETQAADDTATPHERRDDSIVQIPYRDLAHIGPAGGINSCLDDMLSYVRAHLAPGEEGPISAAAAKEMHAPQITIPEDNTFPESTRFGYGLGWLVGQYRGHRIVEHNGGVDGFLTDCMMLPDEGIGIVVLTNYWSPMGTCIAYRAFDELLGLEPIGWPARMKKLLDAAREARAGARKQSKPAGVGRGARPLEAYAGAFEHPGYGRFSVSVADGRLVPSFGTLDLSLTHTRYDVFELAWHELAEQDIRFPVTFTSGPDGDIDALTIPLEDAADPIRFDRIKQSSLDEMR